MAHDDVLAVVEATKLRPQEGLTRDLLIRLQEQAEVSDGALRSVATIRAAYAAALQDEATIMAVIDDAVSDITSANEHAAQAILHDEAGRSAEIEVLRLLQEANLIGFGAP